MPLHALSPGPEDEQRVGGQEVKVQKTDPGSHFSSERETQESVTIDIQDSN